MPVLSPKIFDYDGASLRVERPVGLGAIVIGGRGAYAQAMGTLSYTTAMSLDGYIADASGDFQWVAPDEEIFRHHIDRISSMTAEILGRKTYQLMKYWEDEPPGEDWGEDEREFARLWRGVKLYVASSTLDESEISTTDTELIRKLELERIKQIVSDAPGEVEIFGPTTAAEAIRAGLVDDFRFFIAPILVGGGLAALPQGMRLNLELVEEKRFSGGTVFVHYKNKHEGS